MSVTTQPTIYTYTAVGSALVFAFGCRILNDEDLVVTVGGVLKTLNVDYAVSGIGDEGGGAVSFVVAPVGQVRIFRAVAPIRLTDYQVAGDFLASVVNDDFDRAMMVVQDMRNGAAAITNSLRVPAGEVLAELPAASVRASRVLAFDSLGALYLIVGVDAGSAAALQIDLADAATAGKGAAMVANKRTEVGSVARTLNFYVQHSKLQVSNWCDPTSDTPGQVALNLAAAILAAKTSGKVLEFEGATYTTNAVTEFLGTANLRGLRFWGNGCTIFRNTGAGPVAQLDSSGALLRCDEIEFMDFVLKGQAASTYGLYTRGLCRSRVRARAVDVATAGFKTDWGVTSSFDLTVSNNVDTFTVNPATGLILDIAAGGDYPANCKYHVVMEAPITGTGVDMIYGALGNTFTGTCEGIPTGIRQRATAGDCILFGMDFEANTVQDVLVEGRGLKFVDSEASSSCSSPNIALAATASDVTLRGGFARQVDINAAVLGTTINDLSVSDNVALGITGAGLANWRGSGNVKVNTSRVQTALIPDQFGDTGLFVGTLTGCTTSPSSSINYRRVGDVVTLDLPAITGTSNATTATLTGMPVSIRPTAQRSAVGTVTDNGINLLGRVIVETSGVLTLNVAAATAFTNTGTKGVQACSVVYYKV